MKDEWVAWRFVFSQKALGYRLWALGSRLWALGCGLSAISFRLSAFRLPPSAFRLPPSAFRPPPSAFRYASLSSMGRAVFNKCSGRGDSGNCPTATRLNTVAQGRRPRRTLGYVPGKSLRPSGARCVPREHCRGRNEGACQARQIQSFVTRDSGFG
jgi:hypothetical protein